MGLAWVRGASRLHEECKYIGFSITPALLSTCVTKPDALQRHLRKFATARLRETERVAGVSQM